jgi:phosphoribosylanthranilate isomerase
MTLVKICGVTCLEDALGSVVAGAEALGFNFWPRSPRFIRPERARAIIDALPEAVLKVGVFVDTDPEDVQRIASVAGLDVAQFHGSGARAPRMRWWQALAATGEGLRETMERSTAEAFLIDTPAGEARGGTGRAFDWSLATGLPGRIVLAGGLGPDNVAEAVRTVRPWGVDACSRLELSPGRKDLRKVEEFIRAVRSAEL